MYNYITVINKALEQPDVTINVGDCGEEYDDLKKSKTVSDIIEACEATDSPVVTFFKDGVSIGYMILYFRYEDESIADYTVSSFMESLMESVK